MKIKTPLYVWESYRGLASNVQLGISYPTPWESLTAMPTTRPALGLCPFRLRAHGLNGITVEADTPHPSTLGQRNGRLSHDIGQRIALTPTAQGCDIPRVCLDMWISVIYHMPSEAFCVCLLNAHKNTVLPVQYPRHPTNIYSILRHVHNSVYRLILEDTSAHDAS